MKQFYYGNVYERNGYQALAYDKDIPAKVLDIMTACASTGIDSSDTERFGVIMCGDGAVIYNTVRAAPRTEIGEARPTFFSHQYYVDKYEISGFLRDMPNVLQNISFVKGYASQYDLAASPMIFGGMTPPAEDKELCLAAESVLKRGGHMLIYGQNLKSEAAKQLALTIIASVRKDLRRKASFIALENSTRKNSLTDAASFIFCRRDTFNLLKNHYNSNCIYYDIDAGKIIDTDKPVYISESEHMQKPDYQKEEEDVERLKENIKRLEYRISVLEKQNRSNALTTIVISVAASVIISALITIIFGIHVTQKNEISPASATETAAAENFYNDNQSIQQYDGNSQNFQTQEASAGITEVPVQDDMPASDTPELATQPPAGVGL